MVDYAIASALLGLVPSLLSPALALSVLLQVKMLWDLARHWQWVLTGNPITLIGMYLNVLGALAVALLTWVVCIVLGVWIPLVDHYALAAALLSGSWTLGAAVNQFFLNGYLNSVCRSAR